MKTGMEWQVSNLDLSKRLKELGVKQESHFSWALRTENPPCLVPSGEALPEYRVAAFTTSELGEMLPEHWTGRLSTCFQARRWVHRFDEHTQEADTEADARAKLLIRVLEEKLVTP